MYKEHELPRVIFDPETFRFEIATKAGSKRESLRVKRPKGGYGGHEIVVSPDGAFAALFMYSGQSEQGFELFALRPKLERLRGLPYVFGEGDAPIFSPSSSRLVMAVANELRFWDERGKAYDELEWEDALDDAPTRIWTVQWASLYVHPVRSGKPSKHPLRTTCTAKDDPVEWPAPTKLAFVRADRLRLTTPWKTTEIVRIPRSGAIELKRAPGSSSKRTRR